MDVSWALPCRFAEATPDGTATLVGAGLDCLWCPDVPTDVGIFLMMRIGGPPYEFEEEHTLAVKLVDPEREEQEVLVAKLAAQSGPPALAEPGLDVGMLIPAAISWRAEHFGLYTLEILVDDRRQRSIPVVVRPVADMQQPPPPAEH